MLLCFYRLLLQGLLNDMGLNDVAIEASITSAECKQNLPLRNFSSVLW